MLIKMIHGSLRRVRDQISGYLSNICREILRVTRQTTNNGTFSPLPPPPLPLNNRPSNSDKILLPRNTNIPISYLSRNVSQFSNEAIPFLLFLPTILNYNNLQVFENRLPYQRLIPKKKKKIQEITSTTTTTTTILRPSTSFDRLRLRHVIAHIRYLRISPSP